VRALRVLLWLFALIAVLYLFTAFFVSQLGSSGHRSEPSGVRFAAPAGYAVIEAGELPRRAAAGRLAAELARRPGEPQLALHFTTGGFELFWLVDRDGGGERLVELAAGPTGTRIETTYRGDVAARLAWASAHGDLDAPGTSPGEGRNLFH